MGLTSFYIPNVGNKTLPAYVETAIKNKAQEELELRIGKSWITLEELVQDTVEATKLAIEGGFTSFNIVFEKAI